MKDSTASGGSAPSPPQRDPPVTDPANLGIPFLSHLLSGNGNQGGVNLEFLQQYGSLISGGIGEYIRQMSQGNLPGSNSEQTASTSTGLQSLANFNSAIKTSTVNGKYTVSVPLGRDVKPEDLKVNIKDRQLVVDVKVESKAEDGSSRLYQELTKKINLPVEVKVNEVKTVLSPEGILVIEAPLPQVGANRSGVIEIPVNMDLD